MHMKTTLSAKVGTALATLAFAAGAQAGLLTFDYSVTGINYSVNGSENAADLLNAHNAGSTICSGSADGFVSTGPRQNCGTTSRTDYSLQLHTEFDLANASNLRFQTGADWGRGGGLILTDRNSGARSVYDVTSDDIWWNRDWNNSDVFITELNLDSGAYALTWIGFEGCCAGETTVRYSHNGGGFMDFTRANFQALTSVPEPGTVALLSIGLAGFALLRRQRTTFRAMRASQKTASDQNRGVAPLETTA